MRKTVEWLAAGMAVLGGVALMLVVAVTCVSITGRALVPIGLRPIHGDYELVEIGVGFAVFAALPWCHLKRGHASVEILTNLLSPAVNRLLDVVIDLVILLTALLLTWRLTLGMLDKKSYFETTFILQFEIWQAYAMGLVGAVVFCVIALYRFGESVRMFGQGVPHEQS